MISNLSEEKGIVSSVYYHFIFCTRYKRRIFLNEEITKTIKAITLEICEKSDLEVLSIEIKDCYVDIRLKAVPSLSPNQIMYRLKFACNGKDLKNAFTELKRIPNLWTRAYMVSTNLIDEADIKKFVTKQR